MFISKIFYIDIHSTFTSNVINIDCLDSIDHLIEAFCDELFFFV